MRNHLVWNPSWCLKGGKVDELHGQMQPNLYLFEPQTFNQPSISLKSQVPTKPQHFWNLNSQPNFNPPKPQLLNKPQSFWNPNCQPNLKSQSQQVEHLQRWSHSQKLSTYKEKPYVITKVFAQMEHALKYCTQFKHFQP